MTPVWSISAWQPVRMSVSQLQRHWTRLHRMGRAVSDDISPRQPRTGQVLWGMRYSGQCVGIAWDWEEAQGNVVAMADPMRVATNIVLTDDKGEVVGRNARIVCLNTLIHRLPWQPEFMTRCELPQERLAA